MANLKIATTLRNNMMDEITTFVSTSGKIKIYAGTQPAGGGSPTGSLLATLTCNATAFAGAATGGVLTLNSITQDSAADATGTATWFRLTKSDDTWVLDGDITATGGGGDLELDNTSIVINGTVAMSGTQTLTAPNPA